MQVWNVLHGACCKYRTQNAVKKLQSGHHRTTLSGSLQLKHVSTIRKKLLSSNISSTCFHNMVNFSPLAAEISPVVWDTPANFNGFRVLAALLHGTPVLGISQTLRRWTQGATYIWQGGHHVGHWPTFLFSWISVFTKKNQICVISTNYSNIFHLVNFTQLILRLSKHKLKTAVLC